MTNQANANASVPSNKKKWGTFLNAVVCFIMFVVVVGMIMGSFVVNSASEVTVILGIGFVLALVGLLAIAGVFVFGIWLIRLIFCSKK
ncbi:hypothetical protein [Desulfovibrio litoralis]|uniref:Uncharacterized protein n=1 Tax=Desulfovibrio litoralis DSM 11393 TaxID=1121455 RepID=A0A1M7S0R7_9BACT|nr:hypothetical protein [Desulfovibrio litoralis]SHN52083.1 hypothetical protein SAMN02745728_00419 [Desulfovibrio litoralis DSM 11393]